MQLIFLGTVTVAPWGQPLLAERYRDHQGQHWLKVPTGTGPAWLSESACSTALAQQVAFCAQLQAQMAGLARSTVVIPGSAQELLAEWAA